MSIAIRLRAALLYNGVIRPLRFGKRLWPERMWAPLQRASRRVGAVGGRLARPLLLRDESNEGKLRALLRFTEVAEESLGIRGTNVVVNAHLARRTIERCPFADRIRDVPEFCTAVGGCAGEGAFDAIVPGAEFVVLRTKSRGHDVCEYEYRLPGDTGGESTKQ